MVSRAKRFVLILALAVLPIQGIGASFAKLACHGAAEGHAAPIAHAHDGHEHGTQPPSHSEDGKGADSEHYYSCHHLTVVFPAATLPATPADFPHWARSSYGLPDLFIPDRPQRPPLA
jgi:hypothetical protein